jgi:hypothetical protein
MFHVRWQLAMLMTGGLLLGSAGAGAQEKKAHDKHDASALNASLKQVINAGAKIYNDNGDHAGCFRMYQGALISVKPFLSPELQKKIDSAMMSCDSLGTYAERAFAMRKVLDEIRDQTKGSVAKEPETKGGKDGAGEVTGMINYQGKPLAGGYLVKLTSKSGKSASAPVQSDGRFQFKSPVAVGEYRVTIEPNPDSKLKAPLIPARYSSGATSGLVILVQSGKQQVDLNLVK